MTGVVRWWRVPARLVPLGVRLTLGGGVPAALALLVASQMHVGPCNGAVLLLPLLFVFLGGAVAVVGASVLLFAGCAALAGRVQYARLEGRWRRRQPGDGDGPYRQ